MFLTVSDNSLNAKGAPWINRVVSGLVKEPPCEVCGASTRRPVGDLAVTLEAKGTMWPDALGCGAYPLLILSNSLINVDFDAGTSQCQWLAHALQVAGLWQSMEMRSCCGGLASRSSHRVTNLAKI